MIYFTVKLLMQVHFCCGKIRLVYISKSSNNRVQINYGVYFYLASTVQTKKNKKKQKANPFKKKCRIRSCEWEQSESYFIYRYEDLRFKNLYLLCHYYFGQRRLGHRTPYFCIYFLKFI